MKFTTRQYFVVEYHELNRFITETFGQEFHVVADQEAHNDSVISIEIEKEKPLDEWEMEDFCKYIEGKNPSYMLRILMQSLVNRHLIPAGKWLIEICW